MTERKYKVGDTLEFIRPNHMFTGKEVTIKAVGEEYYFTDGMQDPYKDVEDENSYKLIKKEKK